MKEENKFVGYEYKKVSVRNEMESLWIDSYESFGWMLAYVLYVKIGQKKARQLEPVINQQYDKIYETCERAASLLA